MRLMVGEVEDWESESEGGRRKEERGKRGNRWRWCAAVFFTFWCAAGEELGSHGGDRVKADTMFFIVKAADERARVGLLK
ncbi:hypothetical protein [Paenibacillus andongensis]|uniref:hypothetical protein n=1 Tax=Paenibacillus andongensis TaxID=2975482 RepID=UPI0021BB05E9|nr:hypothetical protein [Paenibacillus andongensis]